MSSSMKMLRGAHTWHIIIFKNYVTISSIWWCMIKCVHCSLFATRHYFIMMNEPMNVHTYVFIPYANGHNLISLHKVIDNSHKFSLLMRAFYSRHNGTHLSLNSDSFCTWKNTPNDTEYQAKRITTYDGDGAGFLPYFCIATKPSNVSFWHCFNFGVRFAFCLFW